MLGLKLVPVSKNSPGDLMELRLLTDAHSSVYCLQGGNCRQSYDYNLSIASVKPNTIVSFIQCSKSNTHEKQLWHLYTKDTAGIQSRFFDAIDCKVRATTFQLHQIHERPTERPPAWTKAPYSSGVYWYPGIIMFLTIFGIMFKWRRL